MNVTISEITDKSSVVVEFNNEKILAQWGEKNPPILAKEYSVNFDVENIESITLAVDTTNRFISHRDIFYTMYSCKLLEICEDNLYYFQKEGVVFGVDFIVKEKDLPLIEGLLYDIVFKDLILFDENI